MKKILLAEDDPFVVEIYSRKIKEAGFDLEIVQTGEEALRKIKEERFDILLLDMVLPGLSGWEVLEAIRKEKEKNEQLRTLKVLVLSNLGSRPEVERAVRMGAERYLIKAHYTPAQVVEEVKRLDR
ncbi:response regulator [bacterium]|nr:response regulator [bacterium]